MKPKFSIIIPLYNTEEFIGKCLDSIKNQKYDNYEVIVINDGSTDKSLEIVNKYTKDKRFKVYSKKNGGLSRARNYALKYVTGDYICFLDSDDYYNDELLLKLSKLKEKYDVIRFKTHQVDENGKLLYYEKCTLESKEVTLEEIVNLEFMELAGINIYSKDFFIKNKFKFEPDRIFEDYGLTPYCLAKAKKIYFLDYFGHNYVKRQGSITDLNKGIERMNDILFHYKNLINKINKDKDISEHNKEIIRSILTEKLYYNLRYVPLKKINQCIKLLQETNALDYINGNKLKNKFIKYCPTFYSVLLKIKYFIAEKMNFQILLMLYLIINFLYITRGTYLIGRMKITTDNFAYGCYNLLFVNCLVIGYMIFKKKFKYKAIDLFLYLAIIFGVIATVFAINKQVSIFGYSTRREGLLHICYYISLTVLSSFLSKDKYKKNIIYTIFLIAVAQVGLGFYQVMKFKESIELAATIENQARGIISNPNFFGTYMILCLSFVVGLFIDSKNKKLNIIYFILTMIFASGLLISNALSSILAFFLILIALTIYLIIKKKYIKVISLIVAIFVPLVTLTKFNLTYAIKDLVQTKDEVIEISKGNMDDSFGTDRMYLWKHTIKIVPKYIWTGAGIDNFAYVFDGKGLPATYSNALIYDKAHCEYLQILVTQGIFALLCWLTIYALIVNEGLISFFKENKTYLVIPVIGYLIQATFNISVIEVAPIFYIALGFCINRDREKYKKLDT